MSPALASSAVWMKPYTLNPPRPSMVSPADRSFLATATDSAVGGRSVALMVSPHNTIRATVNGVSRLGEVVGPVQRPVRARAHGEVLQVAHELGVVGGDDDEHAGAIPRA